jgi:hypothetical protein
MLIRILQAREPAPSYEDEAAMDAAEARHMASAEYDDADHMGPVHGRSTKIAAPPVKASGTLEFSSNGTMTLWL